MSRNCNCFNQPWDTQHASHCQIGIADAERKQRELVAANEKRSREQLNHNDLGALNWALRVVELRHSSGNYRGLDYTPDDVRHAVRKVLLIVAEQEAAHGVDD